MEDEETILSDAASGVVSVLHVKNVPIYLLPKVFEEAMKLVRQYTVPFDPSTLDTSDTSEDSEDTETPAETSSEPEMSDEEANDKTLKMMGV